MSTPPLLTVMGEFTDARTLALVERCSKKAKEIIVPILNSKLHKVILDRFPYIKYLPADQSGQYYRQILKSYFRSTNIPLQVETSHWVGNLLDNHPVRRISSCYVREAMQTAEGRRRVLKSIEEWRVALERTVTVPTTLRDLVRRLDALERNVFVNFAVDPNGITYEYNPDL